IDDFGTGYSSLSHLQDLPIDELKIDRSFVQGLAGSEPRSEGILAGVVALARGLELHIVAEGVEDESSAVTLATLGCDTLQGYLFGKAMPADQFRRMMDG
ncbi:MAG: histidine kinase, partial [Gammaproteobacteria bacterium]|nr:histidine kinase [Gammaproteobacteria bacterium]